MAFPYIETPRTDIDGNATYLSGGPRSSTRHNLSALSIENSFQAPDKDGNLLQEFENARSQKKGSAALRTPRAGKTSRSTRNSVHSRQNLQGATASNGEFTPLMKSVTKNNLFRTADRRARNDEFPTYHNTTGLSNINEADGYEDGSMMYEEDDATPVPQIASSSVQNTPLPALSGRGNNGIVGDGQNGLTLREQENMIDKLNKENFSLKLKIEFLGQSLQDLGPDVNKVALAENAQLKIAQVTMQRDVHRYKKSLRSAERDLVACQAQLEEIRQNSRAKAADDTLQRELDWMREEMESKNLQINALQQDLKAARSKESDEVEKLREEIENLEFTVREKDRLLDDKDEEVENLKQKETDDSNSLTELERELERAKDQMEDIQRSLEKAKSEAKEAKATSENALAEKDQAVEDLRELQDEMANKSFSTKGLSRKLEEKANGLEEELSELRQRHATLQDKLADNAEQERHLQEQLEDLQDEFASERETMENEIDAARNECDSAKREYNRVLSRLREVEDEIKTRGDAKSLLQNRHDALTDESESLQRDLERARETIADLEQHVSAERQESMNNVHELQARHREEAKRLNDEIASLHRSFGDKESQFAADSDKWESSKRTLELQKNHAEQQAAGYKRIIDRLQSTESALSSKEGKLQQMLESEKQRHAQEEQLLNCQIKDLNDEISSRRAASETQRLELLSAKEDLRVCKRETESLKERAQSLEDEVVVLQASLEEQQEYAKSQRKFGASDLEKQLQNVSRERQGLRDQLANSSIELNELRSSISNIEVERDELQNKLRQFETQVDGAHRLDQEKLGLRKAKLRLESEVSRLKEEIKMLSEARDVLQNDLQSELERASTEENRLCAEIGKLQGKLTLASEKRDRQLLSARRTAERLEVRTKELEALIESQEPYDTETLSASPDLSILRHSLELARKKEKVQVQREADLKSSIKELKSHVTDLEKQNYELQTKRLDSVSPRLSISSKLEAEIRSLRGQLLDVHKSMKNLRSKNHELQRTIVDDNERKDLHELLKSSALEAESLSLKLSERDSRVNQLRAHLRRVREERALSVKKEDAINRELEALQDRYETMLDDMMIRPERSGRHEKEIRGLSKEIIWLRARLKREEKFRKDLAWSKGLMKLGERVRVACNETDLRMIAEMGVEASMHEPKFNPRRKFRAVAFAAVAAARMRKMATEWTKARRLGDGLRKAKNEVLKRRENGRRPSHLD